VSEQVDYQTERLEHLGIVAGVCREAGIAAWLDAQAGEKRRQVSVGTAVVAMILNGGKRIHIWLVFSLMPMTGAVY